MKLPCLSKELNKDDLNRMVNNLRQCSVCNHGFLAGGSCPWCAGMVTAPREFERKIIPRVFYESKKVEKAFTEESVEKLNKFLSSLKPNPPIVQTKVRKLRLIEVVYIKIEGGSKRKYVQQLSHKRCGIESCPNFARLSYETCSRLCTVRLNSVVYTPGIGQVVTMSIEEAQKRVDKEKHNMKK